MLALLAEAPAASRVPVTLFAAIHDLLLADPAAELAAWYPNLTAEPRTATTRCRRCSRSAPSTAGR